ncbi:MAG: superoxide dismutase [Fimbriimonadaceae bacterium]|nr:superoxide dismutase [Chitinophagales bacterium]
MKAYAGNDEVIVPETFPADGAFSLPALDYDYAALEPYIDTMTMQIHYSKHHQTYVTKLNEAIEKTPELQGKSLKDLIMNINAAPESVRTAIRNHGGGHYNHSMFWKMMNPKAADSITSDDLRKALMAKWNDMETFKSEFNKSATGLFGSGWTWLIKDTAGALSIVNTANQDNPLMDISSQKGKPILGIDVWEHAYYLKHQNKRADYLAAIWNVIDWNQVSKWYSEM